ncbi:MAG: ImmA/IrrE family metallo-endopeptidase [Clostridiales bacterium]|nr:ImmA/IrrE family metallo-endopeptidase [Clostridiales bacterium]
MAMVSLKCRLGIGGVPHASALELECFARDLIIDFNPELLTVPQKVDMERLVECYLRANLELHTITSKQAILGITIFNGGVIPIYDQQKEEYTLLGVPPRTIVVDQRLADDIAQGRYRFTLAHEAAHLVCHSEVRLPNSKLCRQNNGGTVFMCRADAEGNRHWSNRTPEQWLEWQADYLAGAFLMPASSVYSIVDMYLRHCGLEVSISGWKEMLDRQGTRLWIVRYLSFLFGVSRQAADIRLRTLLKHYPLREFLEVK